MKTDSLLLSQLDLDTKNPRINSAGNQTETLNKLVGTESSGDKIGEKIYVLARSICEEGFDQSDRLMVTPSPTASNRYIVLDGNRRLVALKLLTDPAWAEREDLPALAPLRKRIQALREDHDVANLPQKLDVSIYPSRADAKPFIALRHTGEHDGAGRSQWNSMQQARFENSGTYQLLQHLLTGSQLDLDTRRQLEAGSFAISTFERAAKGAAFADRFEGKITAGSFDPGGVSDLATRAWAKIANDTACGAITSRVRITDRKATETYLDEVLQELTGDSGGAGSPDKAHPGGTPTGKQKNGGDQRTEPDGEKEGRGDPNTGSPGGTVKGTATRLRAKRQSKYLVSKRNSIVASNPKCQKIIDELSDVPVAKGPYACALLIRALLEITAVEYLTVFSLKPGGNATSNIAKLGQDLRNHEHGPDEPADRIAIAEALTNQSSVYDDLCKVAHSPVVQYSPDHVRVVWDNVGRGVDLAWQRIARKSGAGRQQ